jgi:hypothetical protein
VTPANKYLFSVGQFRGNPKEVNCQILITFAAQRDFRIEWEKQQRENAAAKRHLAFRIK